MKNFQEDKTPCAEQSNSPHFPPRTRLWGSSRLQLTLLFFFGNVILYSQRVSFSVCLIAMTTENYGSNVNQTTSASLLGNSTYTDNSTYIVSSSPTTSLSTTTTTTAEIFSGPGAPTTGPAATFSWDSRTQGCILAAFFYGYVITQIPGGYLTRRCGGKIIYAAGVLGSSLMALLSPVAATAGGWKTLWALRFVQGVAQGVMFPTIVGTLSHWSPPSERSTLYSIATTGTMVGVVTSLPLASVISARLGWPGAFYVFGIAGAVWTLFWAVLASDTPDKHGKRISKEELAFIKGGSGEKPALAGTNDVKGDTLVGKKKIGESGFESEESRSFLVEFRGEDDDDSKRDDPTSSSAETSFTFSSSSSSASSPIQATPWLYLISSGPVLAICVSSFAANWCFYTFLVSGPKYMNDVLGFQLEANGLLSAMPYLLQATIMLLAGRLADYLTSAHSKTCTRLTVRRIFNTLGLGLQTVWLLALAFGVRGGGEGAGDDTKVGPNSVALAVALLFCATGFWSFCIAGYMVNPMDVAPEFAGVILGFSNSLGAISGFLGAEVMGALTSAFPVGGAGWRYLFCLSAGMALVATLFYLFFADADVQPWAKNDKVETNNSKAKSDSCDPTETPKNLNKDV